MSSRALWPLLAVTLAFTGACASTSRSAMTSTSSVESADYLPLLHARYVISRGEIAQSGATSAEDVIRRMRPNLLTPRRSRSRIDNVYYTPIVYLDNLRAGGIEALRAYPASILREVRYLSESEANVRFMGAHPAGVIILRTKE